MARLVVLFAAAAVFAYAATHRIVDDDEGYYALAGRAIASGQVPYRDFFLPQMPFGPVAYGVLGALIGPGLVPLRWFAALCALGTAAIVESAARRAGGRRAGVVAVVLFAGHTLLWEWAPTIKTFPLALLLGTAALAVATRANVTPGRLFVAGVLAGLTVAARALSLPLAVAVVVSPFFTVSDRTRRGRLATWTFAGLAAALAPVAILAALDPAAFWFDNAAYHAIRSPGDGLVKDLPQKLDVARAVFLTPFGAARPDATGAQSLLLVAGAVASMRALRSRRRREAAEVAPFALAAVLLAMSAFLPSPAWAQYFAVCVPPASVVVAAGCSELPLRGGRTALILSAYVMLASPAFVDRVVRQPSFLRPAAFDQVARTLDALGDAGVPVAAHDPAYLVAARRAPLREAMNPFARRHGARLNDAERRRFHLFTEADFRDSILESGASFVVGRGVVMDTALPLKHSGYRQAAVLPGATLWVAVPSGPR